MLIPPLPCTEEERSLLEDRRVGDKDSTKRVLAYIALIAVAGGIFGWILLTNLFDRPSRVETTTLSYEWPAELRAAELRMAEDRWYIGEKVAEHNPALTKAERAEIGRAVMEYANLYGVGPELVASVIIVESTGRVDAVSPAGARGLMQVMPHMAREVGVTGDLYVIDNNILAGVRILSANIEAWGVEEGVARYFWGMATPDGSYLAKVMAAREGLRG